MAWWFSLDSSLIPLGATASDSTDAIRQVGRILVDAGYIEPGYVASLLAREKVANTFLGNGIAIPHGVPKSRALTACMHDPLRPWSMSPRPLRRPCGSAAAIAPATPIA